MLLDREKLTLAAGALRRGSEPSVEEAEPIVEDWLGPADLAVGAEEPRRRHLGWLAVAVALAVVVAFVGWFEADTLIANLKAMRP